jgi:hypothetical protein
VAFEAAKRWVKDQFVNDPQVTQRPNQVLDRVEQTLPAIPTGRRMQAVEYIRQYANACYVGRRNHAIPQEVLQRIYEPGTRARRLDAVAQGRAFLEKYGPPESVARDLQGAFGARAQNALRDDSDRAGETGQTAAGESAAGIAV